MTHAAFLPGRLSKWLPQVAKYWFRKKHAFREYTGREKGNAIYLIEDRVKISVAGGILRSTSEMSTT
jgi:hypothetical protein